MKKPVKKTIEQWFKEGLKEPYRDKAIKYSSYYGTSEKHVESLYDALKHGFVWGTTNENEKNPGYWARLSHKIKKLELLNK